ncbi:MAG: DUF2339 domain-containing protein [Phycisphaerales bacterium]
MGEPPHDDAQRELADLRAQLRAMQQRLDALEAKLAAEATAPAEPEPQQPEPEAPRARPLFEELREKKMAAAAARDDAPPAAAAPPVPAEEPEPGAPPTRPRRTWNLSELEWLVGAKGIVLAGVLVLVIAAGFFLKEAWDRGWVDQVPGWVRCSLGAAFGIALVVVGEFFRRRINDLASSGVSAAGLAIVFGSILAAARIYELMPMPVAFGLLALTSLAGVLLGALSNRVLLAGLSLVGAFVVPLVVRTDSPSFVALPAYLLALLAMGLTLAGWKGSGFAVIRRLAWWGTATLGTLWGVAIIDDSLWSPLVFAALVWAMTIAELVASARFFARLRPSVAWPEESTAGLVQREPGAAIELDLRTLWTPEARWINSVFGVTVWAVLLMGYAVFEHAPGREWIVPAAMMAASLIVAFVVAPEGRRLWARVPSARSALATALAIDAAGLLALTIAVGLGGAAEVITWALVGLAAIAFGVCMRFHAASVLGLLFMGFGFARLVTFDLGNAVYLHADGALETIGAMGLRFGSWSAQMAIVAGTVTAAAVMLRRSPYRHATAVIALATVALAFIGPGSEGLPLGAAWAVLAVGAAYLAVAIGRADLRLASLVLLGVGTVTTGIAAAIALHGARRLPANVALSWTDASWALLVVAVMWVVASALPRLAPLARMAGAGVAVLAFAAMFVGDGTPMATLMLCWTLLLVALSVLVAADVRALRGWLLPTLAAGATLAMGALWIGQRAVTDWEAIDAAPLLHRAILTSLLIIASMLAVGWRLKRAAVVEGVPWNQAEVRAALRLAVFVAAGVLGLAMSSSEAYRAVQWMGVAGEAAPDAALSVWWALYAVATIALGVRLGAAGVRWAGLALLGVTASKAVLLDMAALDGLTRIIGSAVVGLILLGAGVGYAAMMGRSPAAPGGGGTTPR